MTDQELIQALRTHLEAARKIGLYSGKSGIWAVIEQAADRIANQNTHIAALQKAVEDLRAQLPRWIPVTERMPENAEAVLVRGYAVNNPRYKATFKGRWIAAHSMLADDFGADSDMDLEYDEAEDVYYVPEGWFERIENWDDYTDIAVCDFTITHWAPLPEPSEENANAETK